MSECSCGCPDCPDTCECAERNRLAAERLSPPVEKPVDDPGITLQPALDNFIKGQVQNRLAADVYSKTVVPDEDLKSAPPDAMGQFVYRDFGGEQIPVRYDPHHFGTRPPTSAEAQVEAQEQLRRRRESWGVTLSESMEKLDLADFLPEREVIPHEPTELERLVMAEISAIGAGPEREDFRLAARRIIAICAGYRP